MTPNNHRANRLRKWKFFSVLPGLLLAHAALATDSLYQNDAVLFYTVPGNPPPNIDATNFVNNNVFTVTFNVYTFNNEFYEPWNVLNYTNIGLMEVNTGLKFDTQTTNVIPHQMAGSFYNAGTISCGAYDRLPAYAGAGQLVVSATNIANPGTVDVGPNGFMAFTGGNVDLSRSTIGLEGFGSGIFNYPISYGLDWGLGIDTNADWSPATNLTPTHSTPYYYSNSFATNLNIVRAVFMQDSSPGVSYKVYFSDNTPWPYLGGGADPPDQIQDNIEWTGSYLDPANGGYVNNYLYLEDDTSRTLGEIREFSRYTDKLLTDDQIESGAAADEAASMFAEFNQKLLTSGNQSTGADMIHIPGIDTPAPAKMPGTLASVAASSSKPDSDYDNMFK